MVRMSIETTTILKGVFIMPEKMLEVCLEDYWRNHKTDSKSLKEAKDKLSNYLNGNLDKKCVAEIDNLMGAESAEAEEQGFINGFKYAIQFFGILKGGVVA